MTSISSMALYKVMEGVNLFLTIISWLIVINAFMSWIIRPTNAVYKIVSRLVQPILAPFRPIARKLIQKGLMIDVSTILALLAISMIRNFLTWLIF